MLAKILNENTKEVQVATGTNTSFYLNLGFKNMEVEESYDGSWYIKGYAPVKPEPPLEEVLASLEVKYNMPRVIREGILANPSMYTEFNVKRARDLEDLAQKVRDLKEGK